MPRSVVYQARTERLEILDKDGNLDQSLMPDLGEDRLIYLYELMHRMRQFDQKGLTLQRQGRMGTWGSLQGQEAAQAGLALALSPDDWLVPSFREHGVMEAIGIPLQLIYAFWRGDERGTLYPDHVRCLPPSVPVGTQFLHAAGLGLALRYRDEHAAAVGCGGDGATSEGDFHEALNFAGVFRSKVVFFIQNNQWAISMPYHRQTAACTIAQKAHGYGIHGLQVDGNDGLAVYAACREALDRARNGDGVTLIEAHTYRLRDHTTADDASRYRSPEELAHWAERDPLRRMGILLGRLGLWDEAREQAYLAGLETTVEAAVEAFESMSPPAPTDIFDHMYKELPWNLREQREALRQEVGA